MAGYDHARALEVARWPLREMLLAFLERAHELALAEYRHQSLLYTIRQTNSSKRLPAPKRPPFLRIKT